LVFYQWPRVLLPDRSTSLRKYLEYWPHEIASHKRPTTLRGYESVVRLHIIPILDTKQLDKLMGADVRHLITMCRQKCLCCTNGYDKNREELIIRNVAKLIQISTPHYKVGKGLPVSDVKRLLSAAKGTRFYPVSVLAATLALRRGELLGLRWSDIDFAKNTLEVAQTVQRASGCLIINETKSDASDAVVPYPRSPARCRSNTRSTRPDA
jgi:integrase